MNGWIERQKKMCGVRNEEEIWYSGYMKIGEERREDGTEMNRGTDQ